MVNVLVAFVVLNVYILDAVAVVEVELIGLEVIVPVVAVAATAAGLVIVAAAQQ